jgi:hypothetical protein
MKGGLAISAARVYQRRIGGDEFAKDLEQPEARGGVHVHDGAALDRIRG